MDHRKVPGTRRQPQGNQSLGSARKGFDWGCSQERTCKEERLVRAAEERVDCIMQSPKDHSRFPGKLGCWSHSFLVGCPSVLITASTLNISLCSADTGSPTWVLSCLFLHTRLTPCDGDGERKVGKKCMLGEALLSLPKAEV